MVPGEDFTEHGIAPHSTSAFHQSSFTTNTLLAFLYGPICSCSWMLGISLSKALPCEVVAAFMLFSRIIRIPLSWLLF